MLIITKADRSDFGILPMDESIARAVCWKSADRLELA